MGIIWVLLVFFLNIVDRCPYLVGNFCFYLTC